MSNFKVVDKVICVDIPTGFQVLYKNIIYIITDVDEFYDGDNNHRQWVYVNNSYEPDLVTGGWDSLRFKLEIKYERKLKLESIDEEV